MVLYHVFRRGSQQEFKKDAPELPPDDIRNPRIMSGSRNVGSVAPQACFGWVKDVVLIRLILTFVSGRCVAMIVGKSSPLREMWLAMKSDIS